MNTHKTQLLKIIYCDILFKKNNLILKHYLTIVNSNKAGTNINLHVLLPGCFAVSWHNAVEIQHAKQ